MNECDVLRSYLANYQNQVSKINYEIAKLNREISEYLSRNETPPQSLLDELSGLHDERDSLEYVISLLEDALNELGC